MARVSDVAIDLCDYDRRDDEEVGPVDVGTLLDGGHVTLKEIIDTIRAGLLENYPDMRKK